MAALKLKNLSKKFGDFAAVSNLNFEVAENRVFGFLGPNGAGKTTTIRAIVGLLKPTAGSIEIAGNKIVFGDAKTNKYFGYLPEQPSFYNWMTGQEYLNFIGGTFNLDKEVKKKKIAELLGLVDLADAKLKKISTYSNGMKQRLGIAQALINDPKVLIMDEPVSALDPIGRREVLNIIENLKKKMTVFLSTHILSDVDRICDDVAIINKGKIITVSPLVELKEKYATGILEVEFGSDPESILSELRTQPWAGKVEKSGNQIKIWLKGEETIPKNLPLKYFAKVPQSVLKYGLILPEIEDLFIDLITEAK